MPWYKDVSFVNNRYHYTDPISVASMVENVPVFLTYQTDYAFAHWIFESFIYICHPSGLPSSVNQRWSKIHIHSCIPKLYMKTFLHSIGIPSARQVSGPLPLPNYTFFLEGKRPLLNSKEPIEEIWLERFTWWVNDIINQNFPLETPRNRIHFVLLPRQKRESYPVNDREVHMDPMIDYVLERAKVKNLEIHKDVILYQTDKSASIQEQMTTVSKADHLLVDMASSFFVNGMFARNCKIIAIGPWRHHETSVILGQVFRRIQKYNTVEFIKPIAIKPGHEYHDAVQLKKIYY